MTGAVQKRRAPRQRGSTLVEFSLVAVLMFMVVFATIEFNRMVLVYTGIANAARAGSRYAIVHGSSRSGSGTDGPSGPSNNPTEVLTIIRNYAGAAPLDPASLTINVTYPDSSNAPGKRVRVSVVYPYDPFTWSSLPLRVNLGSVSQGIIEF